MPRIPAAQRRNDFIQAAVEVIATHGIDGATTRKIADQAKANLAMLHYCYDSKEALFTDVFAYVAGQYRETIEQSNPGTSLADAARGILRGVMQTYLDSPSFTAATFDLISWARRQHEDRGIAVYDQAFDTLRTELRRACTEPVADESIEELAYVLATLADGFAVNWLTYGDRTVAARQMDVAAAALDAWLTAGIEPAPAGR
ncbi:TetR/AcrR family transcriptional regulator [Nocardioides sp.]|uniref:TetR/AcrR family transcriptional regulator n=1 Tax=Nocardioides sp. TaxID=35761 RepID=UPI002C85DB4D|nr:TetR/AcrR family transcriptional regulator [Nocardioides sp.]HSX66611.1 TetR/AcrR family transcriptional regulator [Nocardioides sp.]